MDTRFYGYEPDRHWSVRSFEALGLKSSLLKAIHSQNYMEPTSIQSKAILCLLKAKDTIAEAPPCSGKTTTIVISVLQMIDEQIPHCQAIVLTSTKELARQFKQKILAFGGKMNVSVEVYTDGQAGSQEDTLNIAQILVGTPDDIANAFKRGSLKTDFVRLLVLDEADEIIEKGFFSEIRGLLGMFCRKNKETQLALFANEVSAVISKLSQEFMECPAIIQGRNPELTLEGIKQYYISTDRKEWKFETLMELFDNINISQCVIFCNSKNTVEDLSNKMTEKDFTVSILHGGLDLEQCEISSREFRTGATRIMIMTDEFARSRHWVETYLSINYEVPLVKERYIQRAGRSGAFGRKGFLINFVTPSEVPFLREVERFFNTEINELPFDLNDIF